MTYDRRNAPARQCLTLFLFALHEINRRAGVEAPQTLVQLLSFVAEQGWYEVGDSDLELTQIEDSPNAIPRWHAVMLVGVNSKLELPLLIQHPDKTFSLSWMGKIIVEGERLEDGWFPEAACAFLWSEKFKKYVWPKHLPSDFDLRRPPNFYHWL